MSNTSTKTMKDPLEGTHRERSNFAREIIQCTCRSAEMFSPYLDEPPRRIVQFWNDAKRMPADVKGCLETWRKLEVRGFDLVLFDESQARDFILHRLGTRFEKAFDKCYHPAMQSDYFRLCYILMEGGCYIDADDVFSGAEIEHLFRDGRLKIQPLCYDMSNNKMVPPSVFTVPGADSPKWIFYFNNNPLIAAGGHPLIERALLQATIALERYSSTFLPEIQSTTGPGNLSKSVFDSSSLLVGIDKVLYVLCDWEDIAFPRWPLGYRNDERNWRHSNQKAYIALSDKQE